jgi:hypothetical protein
MDATQADQRCTPFAVDAVQLFEDAKRLIVASGIVQGHAEVALERR